VPFGHCLYHDQFESIRPFEEVNRVCFVGNPDSTRVTFITKLAQAGVEIDIYGANWNRWIEQSNSVKLFPQVKGTEYFKTLRRYRVQLNILRTHNEDSHNMRSFEIPAVGGIMVAPRTSEHLNFFRDGEEAFFYDTPDEIAYICKNITGWSKSIAMQVREQARIRSESSSYSYKDRSFECMSAFDQHIFTPCAPICRKPI
jgi:spore maturation protein CgeB